MRIDIDAFYLPTLQPDDMDGWEERVVEGAGSAVVLRWPKLNANGVSRIARELRMTGASLRGVPVIEIIGAVDRAVDSMRANSGQWNTLIESIATVTGYSAAMSRHVIDRMAADWRASSLAALVDADLGGSAVLDGFAPTGQGYVHAAGPALCFHIFSGNVPGVAVTSIIRALLVKAPSFGKSAYDEPILAASFARALARADPRLANALAIAYWPGGTADLEAAAFDVADTVIHYGGQKSFDDVAARIGSRTRLIDHGPRISFGMVGRDALTDEAAAERLAADVAYAVATFDQQGCVSPHVVFVEDAGNGEARAFASQVADALAALAADLPTGALSAPLATAIRSARDSAEFRSIAGQDVDIFGSDGLSHTVIYDSTPAFEASCLHRTLRIHPVAALEDVIPLVTPFGAVLQSAAIAGASDRITSLALALAGAGATRITRFRDLPWPPPHWHHDGRGPLRELVRFTDLDARPVP